MPKNNTAAQILNTLKANQQPMTLAQIVEVTGLSYSKISQAAAKLARANTQRPAAIIRVDTGLYKIREQNEQNTPNKKPDNIADTILKEIREHQTPMTLDAIINATHFKRKQVKDAILRLTKSNTKREALIKIIDKDIYQLIQQSPDTDTRETTIEPQSETPTGLQHPPDVPNTLPPHTLSISQFEIRQQNVHRLWLLHKSIKQSLHILEPFGETIPNPLLLTDTEEAKNYADAIRTYLNSSILYQQALIEFEKNPLKPLPNQRQHTDKTEETIQTTSDNTEQEPNEPKNFTFAGENFETIKDLQDTIEMIKLKSKINTPLTGTDQTILFQLIKYADNAKDLVRGGIQHFEVQLADRKNTNSRIICMIKADGNKTRIPTTECIRRYKMGEHPAEIHI